MFCASASLEGFPSPRPGPSAASPSSSILAKEALLEGTRDEARSEAKNIDFF